MNEYSSRSLNKAVNELSRLPGIGKRTALRLCLHLLKLDKSVGKHLAEAIDMLVEETQQCKICHNLSDDEICEICANPSRKKEVICVVEDIRDVMAIENTDQFSGKFHVLGGIIAPMEGIGPSDLNINDLIGRIQEEEIREVMFALPATIEGDTTAFYIFKTLQGKGIRFTTIARGIAIGDDLEFTDEVTLGRSIVNRLPYESSIEKFR